MHAINEIIKKAPEIEAKIGYTFNDLHLLALAFTHRSFVNENKEISQHNERLEFLGDSVLGMLVSDYLYCTLPNTPEGDLSYLRSRLVEAASCVAYIQKFCIESYLILGKGERMNDGRGRESILADLFEALMGAIFLDGGIQAAKDFYFNNFSQEINAILKTPLQNWKALLQDLCQKNYQQTPVYKIEEESGPDHSKRFKIAVFLNDTKLGAGEGNSKKEAQQAAAADALTHDFLPKE